MESKNFENVCRICLVEVQHRISLFTTNTFGINQVLMGHFLHNIVNVEVTEGDGLPANVCVICAQNLSDFFDFVQLCCSSDARLRSQLMVSEAPEDGPFSLEEASDSQSAAEEFQCTFCNVSFASESKLNKHKKSHSSNEYACEECPKTFAKQFHLKVHLRSHIKDKDKKFGCDVCGKQYNYSYLLNKHKLSHVEKKPFPCTVCDKTCVTRESLRRHLIVHSDEHREKKHSCKICSKEFAYPSFLAEHMKNHTGERPYLCSMCGKGFRQSGALHYHQRVHTGYKPFQCNICAGYFMSQSVLKVHMRKHTNERPFICHVCGKAFRQSTDLKSHQRTHSGDKPVLCTICGKRMSTTGQLTIHIRTHTGEKPFICAHCPKAFTTKNMLVKHERIHTGERPYVCDICGRAFNQSSTLKTHKTTHQPNRTRSVERRKSTKCVPRPETEEKTNTDVPYKDDIAEIETEIVTEDFMGDGILLKEQELKTQFALILPAPIPLMENL